MLGEAGKMKWLKKVTKREILELIVKKTTLWTISWVEKLIGLDLYWDDIVSLMALMRADDESERNNKKNNATAWWFGKHKKILGAKGGSWRLEHVENGV